MSEIITIVFPNPITVTIVIPTLPALPPAPQLGLDFSVVSNSQYTPLI